MTTLIFFISNVLSGGIVIDVLRNQFLTYPSLRLILNNDLLANDSIVAKTSGNMVQNMTTVGR